MPISCFTSASVGSDAVFHISDESIKLSTVVGMVVHTIADGYDPLRYAIADHVANRVDVDQHGDCFLLQLLRRPRLRRRLVLVSERLSTISPFVRAGQVESRRSRDPLFQACLATGLGTGAVAANLVAFL